MPLDLSFVKEDPLYLTIASCILILIVISLANVWFSFKPVFVSSLAISVLVAAGFLAIGRSQLINCPPCSGVKVNPYADGPFLVFAVGVLLQFVTSVYLFINGRPESDIIDSTTFSRAQRTSYIIQYSMLVVLFARKAMTKCPPCE